jgi:hypothetical protein
LDRFSEGQDFLQAGGKVFGMSVDMRHDSCLARERDCGLLFIFEKKAKCQSVDVGRGGSLAFGFASDLSGKGMGKADGPNGGGGHGDSINENDSQYSSRAGAKVKTE